MRRFQCVSLLIAFFMSAAAAPQSVFSPVEEWREEELLHDFVSGDSCPSPDPSLYYQPVIGIVTHPGDGASGRLSNSTDTSNIPASYVKFVESAGARVIPLIYNEPWDAISEKLELVNGVLFTGGWAKEGLYFETIKKVLEFTLARNDAGDHFPLFAICLGFELISMIISQDHAICEHFMAKNQASTLQFANISNIQGSAFERFPPELLKKLSSVCLAMQNHRYGLSPRRLQENDALSSFFNILTTSIDENDEVYISTAQAYKYPVTCFQWHPEKNAFEWGSSLIPHSDDAIRVTQLLANYFISEARKSLKRPPSQRVRDNLIYKYNPIYGGKAGLDYLFPLAKLIPAEWTLSMALHPWNKTLIMEHMITWSHQNLLFRYKRLQADSALLFFFIIFNNIDFLRIVATAVSITEQSSLPGHSFGLRRIVSLLP